jgi:hypothetical protein
MIPEVSLFERGREFESPDAIGALSLTPLSSQTKRSLISSYWLERGKG